MALDRSVRHSINDYLSDLYKLVKSNSDEVTEFEIGATGMRFVATRYFWGPSMPDKQEYQITYTLDYQKKPYVIQYKLNYVNNDIVSETAKEKSSTQYTDLAQAELAFKEKLISNLKDGKNEIN